MSFPSGLKKPARDAKEKFGIAFNPPSNPFLLQELDPNKLWFKELRCWWCICCWRCRWCCCWNAKSWDCATACKFKLKFPVFNACWSGELLFDEEDELCREFWFWCKWSRSREEWWLSFKAVEVDGVGVAEGEGDGVPWGKEKWGWRLMSTPFWDDGVALGVGGAVPEDGCGRQRVPS